jgi:general secretion pathway protein G
MKDRRNTKKNSGFTMIELMAVLIIMGLLFAVVAGKFVSQTDDARVRTTKASLKTLHSLVTQFKMDSTRYPFAEEGLDVLINQPMGVENYPEGGYIETTEIGTDGWGREFIYEEYPESGKPFVIKSLGADGEPGGEKYDADLLSTDR